MDPAYKIVIRKMPTDPEGKGPARWVVSRAVCLLPPDQSAFRTGPQQGELVEWVVEKPATAAHIQFTDLDLFENHAPDGPLTNDKTAVVRPDQPLRLRMKAKEKHNGPEKRKLHYYAVWVEETGGAGNCFAVGHTFNPPPEINVGP